MRIECDLYALTRAALACVGVVRTDKDSPALSCLKLSTDGDRLSVLAYDRETWLRQTILGVTVDEPGSCLVPARNLVDWLGEFTKGTVSLTHDGTRTHASIGPAGRGFAVFPLDQYPEPDPDAEFVRVTHDMRGRADDIVEVKANRRVADVPLPCAALLAAFARVGFCVDRRDSSRFVTTGVNLSVKDCSLTLCATDMNHMAVTHAETAVVGVELDETIPRDVLRHLSVVLAHEEEVTLSLSEHSVVFKGRTSEVGTRLLAGTFPPWRKLAELNRPDPGRRLVFPTVLFAQAVRQATAGITEGDKRFQLDIDFSRDGATLSVPVADAPQVPIVFDHGGGAWTRLSTYHPGLLDFLRVALSQNSAEVEFFVPPAPTRPWLLRALPAWYYYPARMVEPVKGATGEPRP